MSAINPMSTTELPFFMTPTTAWKAIAGPRTLTRLTSRKLTDLAVTSGAC